AGWHPAGAVGRAHDVAVVPRPGGVHGQPGEPWRVVAAGVAESRRFVGGVGRMDPGFWHRRWQDGRIGFHQERVTPLLEQHWDSVGVPAGARVFVPLAGKSLDMAWLAARGHPVLGVELSRLAVEQFFAEHGLAPEVHETGYGRHYRAGGIELVC